MIWIMQKLTEETRQPGDPMIDATKNRMIVLNLIGKVITYVQDPEVVAEMYNKHNANLDKHPWLGDIFEPMFTDVFIVMPTNSEWKAQRKAVSHMFFKQRLQLMAEVFKGHLNKSCDKWLAEIAESKQGETRINIAVEFERIYAHTINHICFGEDFNDDKFDFIIFEIDGGANWSFKEEKVSMREAIHNMTFATMKSEGTLMMHPISGPLHLLFDTKVEMGAYFRNLRENSARLKRQVNKYVQRRKSGVDQSKMQGYDLLSVFLEDQQMFSDERIVSNLIGFIFAATETTQYTT